MQAKSRGDFFSPEPIGRASSDALLLSAPRWWCTLKG